TAAATKAASKRSRERTFQPGSAISACRRWTASRIVRIGTARCCLGKWPKPARSSGARATGVKHEPHTFQRGDPDLSTSRTESPCRAKPCAATGPAIPAPTTITSQLVDRFANILLIKATELLLSCGLLRNKHTILHGARLVSLPQGRKVFQKSTHP